MLKQIDSSLPAQSFVMEGVSSVSEEKRDILLKCLLDHFILHYPMEYERIGMNGFGTNAQLVAEVLGVSLTDESPQIRPGVADDFKRMVVSTLLELLESDQFPEVTVRYGEFQQTATTGNWVAALCRDIYPHLQEAVLRYELDSPRIDRPDNMDFRR